MNVTLLLIVLWIESVVNATTRLIIDASNCDGPQKTVIDDAKNKPNITSHCNCTIKSNFSGDLIIASNDTCSPGFYVFDDNGFNETICDHKRAHFCKPVNQGDKLKLALINKSSSQSENPGDIVRIYANKAGNGLFSVTCGAASDSNTKATRPTFVTGTIEEQDTHDHNLNASKPEFPYMYAVAAGCIVVVVALIIFLFCVRRKTRARKTGKEETDEARTFDNTTDDTENPENVDSNEQRQLPDNPLYQSYQVNDDGGYSTCGIESIAQMEQLPDNPLYHSHQENGDKDDSKQNNGKDAGTLSLKDSNAVYAQPNKLAKVSNSNQDNSNESQNENVYAQVNKTKET
uniref:Uncharacterized protein LOC111103172 isoform X2 n=1 Tax=Crassostrea virginica TaxID=6565 RepID=A0A8B8AL70_CRAVI|nr:uncharacterized protein LOC111103172 isoform X2 [Crassostrea virginica]